MYFTFYRLCFIFSINCGFSKSAFEKSPQIKQPVDFQRRLKAQFLKFSLYNSLWELRFIVRIFLSFGEGRY